MDLAIERNEFRSTTYDPRLSPIHARPFSDATEPAAHAAGYVMAPGRGSADEPGHGMTPAAGNNTHDPSYFVHDWPKVLALIDLNCFSFTATGETMTLLSVVMVSGHCQGLSDGWDQKPTWHRRLATARSRFEWLLG